MQTRYPAVRDYERKRVNEKLTRGLEGLFMFGLTVVGLYLGYKRAPALAERFAIWAFLRDWPPFAVNAASLVAWPVAVVVWVLFARAAGQLAAVATMFVLLPPIALLWGLVSLRRTASTTQTPPPCSPPPGVRSDADDSGDAPQ